MTFTESIEQCFKKYATFEGTASRSEFWWFMLFLIVAGAVIGYVSEPVGLLFNLGTIVPSFAAGCRRLHDTDRSGWWQLLWFVPVIGWIVLLVFLVQDTRPNGYGIVSRVPA